MYKIAVFDRPKWLTIKSLESKVTELGHRFTVNVGKLSVSCIHPSMSVNFDFYITIVSTGHERFVCSGGYFLLTPIKNHQSNQRIGGTYEDR
jgi:hypothetical protein